MNIEKRYLGDAVYAEFDGYHVILTTENGSSEPTNTIFLDPQVMAELARFAKDIVTAASKQT